MLAANPLPVSTMDFSGMAQLRARAGQTPDAETRKEVAGQFEALFVQMMLKSMRDAIPKSDLFGSDQVTMYQEMHDKQMAMEISKSGGLGLAQMIEAQMQTQGLQQQKSAASDGSSDVSAEVTTEAEPSSFPLRGR